MFPFAPSEHPRRKIGRRKLSSLPLLPFFLIAGQAVLEVVSAIHGGTEDGVEGIAAGGAALAQSTGHIDNLVVISAASHNKAFVSCSHNLVIELYHKLTALVRY